MRWIRSYVVHESDGGLGTICIYQASSHAYMLMGNTAFVLHDDHGYLHQARIAVIRRLEQATSHRDD